MEEDKKITELERQIKIKDTYLRDLILIAYDYDGCRTEKSLKGLIDELAELAKKALHNDDKSVAYIGDKKLLNILNEEIDLHTITNPQDRERYSKFANIVFPND